MVGNLGMGRITKRTNLEGVILDKSFEDFLEGLKTPTWFFFEGEETNRTRMVSTLLHGNEPSGARALYQLFRNYKKPRTNMICFIGSIKAALTSPRFSFRFLPEAEDLNRAFKPPFSSPTGQLAQELIGLIESHQPEAIVDIHNTSGSSSGFSITTKDSDKEAALATLFTDRLIITELNLGSLMEYAETVCPCVTIECGGIEDAGSDIVAHEGIKQLWELENIFDTSHAQRLEKIYHPMRLELKNGANVGYSSSKVPEWDITLPIDVEKYNYKTLDANESLGWIKQDDLSMLQILNYEQHNVINQYFYTEHHKLKAKVPLKLFMVTTNPNIAKADCLFYIVELEASG